MIDTRLPSLIARSLGVKDSEVHEQSDSGNTRNWDSMRQVTLMTELEMEYGIEFTEAEILESRSVALIRAALRRHGID